MASWASIFFLTVPSCFRYMQGLPWTCCYYFLILSPLPQCWDCKHVTPPSVFCGAEAAIQGVVHGRPALSQLSSIPRYLCCSNVVCLLFSASFYSYAVSTQAFYVYIILSYRPTWLFPSLAKSVPYDFLHECGIHVHVCRCTCTCVCMPEVGMRFYYWWELPTLCICFSAIPKLLI